MNTTIKVDGMTCQHCVKAVEKAVQSQGASAKVDLAKGSVDLQFDESKTTLAALKAAIEDTGYSVPA